MDIYASVYLCRCVHACVNVFLFYHFLNPLVCVCVDLLCATVVKIPTGGLSYSG